MSGTTKGARRGAATKAGLTPELWAELRERDLFWCSWCSSFRPRERFSPTPNRGERGVHCYCNPCRVERRAVKGRAA